MVTLRALNANRAETVVIIVEADTKYWTCSDRFKVVAIKESGLAQCTFNIIPKKVGFLPYPPIYVHKFVNELASNNSVSFSVKK